MDKDGIIRQLKRENESLKGRIRKLEAKLAMYENAHTPPSLKRNGNRKKDQNEGVAENCCPGTERVTRCLRHIAAKVARTVIRRGGASNRVFSVYLAICKNL